MAMGHADVVSGRRTIGGRHDRLRTCLSPANSLDSMRLNSIARNGLAQVNLFSKLEIECLDDLLRVSVLHSFSDGQLIYLQDDDARFLYVVVAGYVRLSHLMEDGSALLHDVLPRNAVFGEFSVLDRSTHPDMATAVGQVILMSFPATAMFDLARKHPALGQILRGAVSSRYRAYINLVRDLSLQSLSARLARTLLRMADRLGNSIDDGGRRIQTVGAMVTQTDLGLMARGSRGNVNRTLQAWQRAGWIRLKERSVLILDREALSSLAAKDQD